MVLLKKRKSVGENSTSKQHRYKDRTKRTRKVMSMLLTIMFVLTLGWCLHFFLPLLFLRFGPKVCNLALPALFRNQSTSAINPCIYLLYIKNYRCSFRQIWRSLYRRCMKTLSSNNKIKAQDISTVCRGTVEGQQKWNTFIGRIGFSALSWEKEKYIFSNNNRFKYEGFRSGVI